MPGIQSKSIHNRTLCRQRKQRAARYLPILLILLTVACGFTQPSPTPVSTPLPVKSTPSASTPSATVPSGSTPIPPLASATPVSPTTTAVSAPTSIPMPLPAAIIETSPLEGSEIPLDGALTLYFNQPMERLSVESAISGNPPLTGRFSWADDATLTFTPDTPLLPDTELTLSVGAGALSAKGQPFAKPVTLHYRTVGFLELTDALPASDSAEVDPTSAIVAVFNRPVVPLGADPATLPAAFSVEPAAPGRGEWVNTSVYIFYPEPGLEGGKTHRVTLNPSLTGANGSPLQSVQSWSFTTARPVLLSTSPAANLSMVGLDEPVVLTFNQPMDRTSVEGAFSVITADGQPHPGALSWDEASTELTFTPSELYNRNTFYTISLDNSAASRGGSAIAASVQSRFHTVPALDFQTSTPADGGFKEPQARIALYFNSILPEEGLEEFITISPPVANLQVVTSSEPGGLILYASFLPETSYVLTLSPSFADAWGSALGQPVVIHFSTTSLRPELYLTALGELLFVTTHDKSLPVQGANISTVVLSRSSVPEGDFLFMLSRDGYELRQNYFTGDETYWQQIFNLPGDRVSPGDLMLSPDGSALLPGLYYLRVNVPELTYNPGPFLLVVSNVQLTFKTSPTDVLVWAVDLNTHTPVSGEMVRLFDNDGTLVASGQTDANGVFQAPLDSGASFAILGQLGDEHFSLAAARWNTGVTGWSFGLPTAFDSPGLQTYLYTDRPIYRPGQSVFFRAIPRQESNGRYTSPTLATLPLAVYDGQGVQLASFNLPLSVFGSAHGEFSLPPTAAPGYYRLEAGEEPNTDYIWFQVAEYRKPEINLSVAFDSADGGALAGSTLNAIVNARYFFDAPATHVPVQWALYAEPSSFRLPGFQVGLDDTRWLESYFFLDEPFSAPLAKGEGLTGLDGLLSLEILTLASDSRQTYTLEVTAQDESGLPVSARASIEVNPAPFYIALRPDVWVAQAGNEIGFDVLTVDWAGNPTAGKPLHADFQKVTWTWERADEQYAISYPVAQYFPVASVDPITGGDGLLRLAFTPPDPGSYILSVYADGARTELLLWVGGPGQATWPNLPNQRLRLALLNPPAPSGDRPAGTFLPGDTAQLFIANPFGQPAPALVTIERGRVMRYQTMTLDAAGSTLDLPLSADDAPNVYVAVTLLGQTGDGAVDFRQGFIELQVAPLAQTLNVVLTGQPQRAGPGEEVTFVVRVTDSAGNPVQGEFSLAVIDLAVLSLADPNSLDIQEAFYGEQPLGVNTALSLAAYAGRLVDNPPGGRGGGGGSVPSVIRENFPDTAFWNAEIVTDANGEAQVTLALPDSLTTWMVEVRGVTQDTRVGQAEIEVVATKDLLIRPVTPRFLVQGDRVRLAAVVQNNTLENLLVDVSLDTSGFLLDETGDSGLSSLIVPAQDRILVTWWGVAQDVAEANLVFRVAGRGADAVYEDVARPVWGLLPVYRYTVPQTFGTAGVVDSAADSPKMELVSLPATFDPASGGLEIELAPSLAAALVNSLDVLEHYPYECTEQTLSRFLPNLEAYLALQSFGIDAPELKARLDRTVNDGLARLIARQRGDGGWGWWIGQSWEASDPYITAYVLFGLARARAAGFAMDENVLARASDFLTNLNFTGGDAFEPWELDRLAFAQFALAEAGRGSLSTAVFLYESRSLLSPASQAVLALALDRLDPGSGKAGTLLSDVQSAVQLTATGAFWDSAERRNLSTPISSSALVVYALSRQEPASALLPNAMRYLMAHRGADGAWASTFETAWVVMAGVEFMKGTGELGGSFGFLAALNSAPIATGQASGAGNLTPVSVSIPISQLSPVSPNALTIHRDGDTGRLYYSAHLTVSRPVEEALPLSRGLSLSRQYFVNGASCSENQCLPVNSAMAGQKLTVRLTLSVQRDAYYLVVEDYIPAGAEILDTSLKTSQQTDPYAAELGPLFDPRNPFAEGWGWWLFHAPQIYDNHIAFSADYLAAGTYELTYTLVLLQPGEFRVLPAHAWEFYFPEVQATTAGEVFTIE